MSAFLYLITVLIWGTTFFAITFQVSEVSVLQSVFYRFSIAALVMWTLSFLGSSIRCLALQDHVRFAGIGLFMFSLNYILVYMATLHLVSGLVSVIFSTLIVFNCMQLWLFYGEKPEQKLLLGACFGIVGIASLFVEDFFGEKLDVEFATGVGLAFASTVCASTGNVIARTIHDRGVNVMTANTWGMTYGSLFLLLVVLISGESWQFSTKPSFIVALLYLSVFGTVVAFFAYVTLMGRIGGPRAAYATILFALVALSVSTLFEGMQWTAPKLIGVALILSGNFLILPARAKAKSDCD